MQPPGIRMRKYRRRPGPGTLTTPPEPIAVLLRWRRDTPSPSEGKPHSLVGGEFDESQAFWYPLLGWIVFLAIVVLIVWAFIGDSGPSCTTSYDDCPTLEDRFE